MMTEIQVLILLFLAAVAAATFIPSQAEIILAALLATRKYSAWALVATASLGNILGGIINYYLGYYIRTLETKKWFPIKQKHLQKAENIFQRYGPASLLLAGVPFIGDPLSIAAGMLRVKMRLFLPLTAVSKTARYVLIWLLYIGLF